MRSGRGGQAMEATFGAGEKMMNRWWRVGGALLMTLPWGALYAWSIFVLPLEQEFGWTRTDTSWVFTIAVFVFGLSFIAAGRLQDKKGPFWISVAGSVLFSLGWVLATYAKDLTSLYLTMGVVLGIGGGIGAFILRTPPAAGKPQGWVPAAAPAKVTATRHEYAPGEVVKTPAFYYMWIAYALGTGAGLMLISQLVPLGRQQLNTVDVAAKLAIAGGAVGNASGRIFSGWLSDKIGRLQTLRLMVGVSVLAFLALPHLSGAAMLYGMVFVVSYCYGTQLSVYASTTGDFFGTKKPGG